MENLDDRNSDTVRSNNDDGLVASSDLSPIIGSPLRVISFLAVVAGLVVLIGVCSVVLNQYRPNFFGFGVLSRFFDLNGEANVSSWYSSFLWIFAAALVWVISIYHRNVASRAAYYWFGICAVCIFLSVDEAAMIHETIGDGIGQFFRANDHLRIDRGWLYSWMYWGLGFVAVLGVIYLRFLFTLPRTILFELIGAGVVFLSGAIGVELVSAWAEHDKIAEPSFSEWTLLIAVEESLELLGVLIFIHTLLRYLKMTLPSNSLKPI